METFFKGWVFAYVEAVVYEQVWFAFEEVFGFEAGYLGYCGEYVACLGACPLCLVFGVDLPVVGFFFRVYCGEVFV